MKIIFLIFVCGISIIAQTQDDLQKKYGTPLSVSYEVRPDILAVLGYSKDGKACTLNLESKQKGSKLSENQRDILTEIIDELVPEEKRGKNMLSGFISAPDFGSSIGNYENVQITRSVDSKKQIYAFVMWKDKDCEKDYGKPFSFDEKRESFTFSEAYKEQSNY